MITYVPASPNVCFCTTCGKHNKQNITFLFNAVLLGLFDQNITHLAHFARISSILVDSSSNCLFVQLLTVNIQNINYLCKNRQADAFSIR